MGSLGDSEITSFYFRAVVRKRQGRVTGRFGGLAKSA